MASESSGDAVFDVLIPGTGIKGLRAAAAFGTSMAPFIKPGAEIYLEPLVPDSLRPGDVIMFESSPGVFITHRVVKRLLSEGKRFYQTKGDNRLHCDGFVPEEKIAGRVIRVGAKNIRTPAALFGGRVLAFLSYGQAVLYRALSLPARVEPAVSKWTNPLAWLAALASVQNDFRVRSLRRELLRHGVVLAAGSAEDVTGLTKVWNEVFPQYLCTPERLSKFIFAGPRFEKSELLLIKKSDRLLGWALFYPQTPEPGIGRPDATGAIDIFAVCEEACRIQADLVFIREILERFRRRGICRVIFNPHPVPISFEGLAVTPLLTSASAFGFAPFQTLDELTLDREAYAAMARREPKGVLLRPYEKKDETPFRQFLERSGRWDTEFFPEAESHSGLLVAAHGEKIVGCCRCLPETQIQNCLDVYWQWVAAAPERPRGYFFRLWVDKDFRGRGIGTALAGWAFDFLFKQGCEEIILLALRDHQDTASFYKRFGFKITGTFLKLRRLLSE